MLRTVSDFILIAALGASLAGCGLAQRVADGTTSTARAIFYKQVKTLHLDLDGRAAINADTLDMNGLSVPTLVRIYQLRDNKAVEKASYDQLLNQSDSVLSADLLAERAVVVKPGEGALLSQPMDLDTRFVAVAALFRAPDAEANSWRLVLRLDDLDPDRPRVIELRDSQLTLRPRGEE
ncbi:hypothetical protein PS627_00248 [Pseudomonas fluorescens]|uniref:type VI secretion system lipoprotein TssJ n=1 Tax=Pseudomonas fluorescens TaxID=294 RepID=UPI00125360BA|nr:type VI secretion system lipoprotein TssJ [Pseudomonas fluorescens]CAG8863312.1 hypothetical protein PS627_00248 [Pseudomonas fluorescens]